MADSFEGNKDLDSESKHISKLFEVQRDVFEAQTDAYEKYTLALVKILQLVESNIDAIDGLDVNLSNQFQELQRTAVHNQEILNTIVAECRNIYTSLGLHDDQVRSMVSKVDVHSCQLTTISNQSSQQSQRFDDFLAILQAMYKEQLQAKATWTRVRVFFVALGIGIGIIETLVQLNVLHLTWNLFPSGH